LFLLVFALCPLDPVACHAATRTENQADVSDLYAKNCARCHGKDGKGKEGRKEAPAIPDLTNHKWHGQRSDAQLTVSILDGKGKDMPAFGDKVTPEQAKALVNYIRKFDEEKSKSDSLSRAAVNTRRSPLYGSVILLGTLLYPIKEQHPCSRSSDIRPPAASASRCPLVLCRARAWRSWRIAVC
jgi:mono/diheme cytochrome c family protein